MGLREVQKVWGGVSVEGLDLRAKEAFRHQRKAEWVKQSGMELLVV